LVVSRRDTALQCVCLCAADIDHEKVADHSAILGHGVEAASHDPYAQVPLPRGDPLAIRLLEVLPDPSDERTSIISCNLRQATLDDTYVALSYMWGNKSENLTIKLNGAFFKIHRNLWEFLRQERHDQGQQGARMLWIDALCIKQESVLEKNHQVPLMGQIYSNASSVLIWLGLETTEMRLCFDSVLWKESLEYWRENWERYREHWLKTLKYSSEYYYDFRDHSSEYYHDFSDQDDKNPPPPPLETLNPFMNHEYWSRVWILQECTLAKELQLRCGSRLIPETSLFRMYTYLDTIVNVKPLFVKVIEASISWRNTADRNYLPLFDHTTEGTACSNPRDLIYSRVSLTHPSQRIIPDYNKTLLELFEEVAQHTEWNSSRTGRLSYLAYKFSDSTFGPIWTTPVVEATIREARDWSHSRQTKEEFFAQKTDVHPQLQCPEAVYI
jgi:hypothetical protein